jgi:hypothetical protein
MLIFARKYTPVNFYAVMISLWYALEQVVEALRYVSRLRVRIPVGLLESFIELILPTAIWP